MPVSLGLYRIKFEDGSVESICGRWEAHAWAIASHLFPEKKIVGIEPQRSSAESSKTNPTVA